MQTAPVGETALARVRDEDREEIAVRTLMLGQAGLRRNARTPLDPSTHGPRVRRRATVCGCGSVGVTGPVSRTERIDPDGIGSMLNSPAAVLDLVRDRSFGEALAALGTGVRRKAGVPDRDSVRGVRNVRVPSCHTKEVLVADHRVDRLPWNPGVGKGGDIPVLSAVARPPGAVRVRVGARDASAGSRFGIGERRF